MRAANAAACGELQRSAQYWAIHDFFFAHQSEIKIATLTINSKRFWKKNTAINTASLQQCMHNESATSLIQRDQELGRKFHVESTPTIFINGRRKVGIRDDQDLSMFLDEALLQAKLLGHTE